MAMHVYDQEYYRWLRGGPRRSAEIVVPLLLDLVRPRSVVDVGCGTGAWLSAFFARGVKDLLGIDGPYVPTDQLLIESKYFLPFDLSQPVQLGRQFDLVVSLEVGEHLAADSASVFVDTLVGLGPVVLFSAAVPFQGGEHHVNEQWPDYWAALFADREYELFDCVRGRIWWDDAVEWWYRQNILIYAAKTHLQVNTELAVRLGSARSSPLSLIHPDMYRELHQYSEWLREERERILHSHSWRITAPLRALTKAARTLRISRRSKISL